MFFWRMAIVVSWLLDLLSVLSPLGLKPSSTLVLVERPGRSFTVPVSNNLNRISRFDSCVCLHPSNYSTIWLYQTEAHHATY